MPVEQLSVQEENEKKKEYLRGYQKSLKREQDILNEIQELRADKMFPSIVNDGMPHGSSQTDLSAYAATLDEMIEELKQERLKRAKLRWKILRDIRALENEDEQKVLRLRYIKRMKWEEIATEMGYTYRRALQIHGKALRNFKISA